MVEDTSEVVMISVQTVGDVTTARFVANDEPLADGVTVAIAAICDHTELIAKALDLLSFHEGADLLRGAAEKIRLKAARKTG